MNFNTKEYTVFLATHGSRAYGTSVSDSDIDRKGFAVVPFSAAVGYTSSFEQDESKSEEAGVPVEQVVYDIRKFVKLAAGCNPSIIEILFVAESDVLVCHPAGALVRAHRDKFLSKLAGKTFSGYALSQLKRLKNHRGYLMNPPKGKPSREDFGLSTQMKITADMMGALDKSMSEGYEAHQNVIELVQKEKQCKSAMDQWQSYQNWKTNRNPKRAEMEAKWGYDSKHAMHLVRLLRMGREILEGKGVEVRRSDAEELLAIRNGAWSYEHLVDWAEKTDKEVGKLYSTSTLPEAPDSEFLNTLCVEAQKIFWKQKGELS